MQKKSLAVLTVAIGALMFAACGNQKNGNDTSGAGTVESAENTPSPTGANTAKPNTVPEIQATPPLVAADGTVGQDPGAATVTPAPVPPPVAVVPQLSKTYEKPASSTTHSVQSSNPDHSPTVNAFSYALPSGATTIPYPIIDLRRTEQLGTGTFTDSNGVSREGYKFTIAYGDSPLWGGAPRVEFDSASAADQNPPSGEPSSNGWGSGVIRSGDEMWFVWSMYLDPSFSTTQDWATLFQLHPGNTNWDGSSATNAWPNAAWPGVTVNGDKIGFGLGPDSTSARELWSSSVSALRGHWVDFAFHAKFSTGAQGLMEFYVDGKLAGSATGNNMPYGTTGGTAPWYYLKQGYYRAASTGSTDSVYQTPVVVKVVSGS